ncbi:MAG: hypothetical protein ACI9E1_001097 [Cryomorphaceae bacterium]|jgi:hypothetical protein
MSVQNFSDTKSAIFRILFFTLMIGLTVVYIMFNFKGLTSKYGMDQAQVGRQIAKNEGITTKFIRPVALQQLEEAEMHIDMYRFYDTTHSPLNSLIYAGVIKAFGGDDPEKFAMSKNQDVYELDRIIAGTCVLFFMISIGINFILISNMFDTKIAAMVAILMLVSEHFWNFSQSGLPQMLMLAIFSGACYLIWKGVQKQEAGLSPIVPVILSGFMFGLLALAHWMTLWIFFGYILFAVSYFKPRGIAAIFVTLIVAIFIAGPLIFNAKHSDGLMGTAYYYINGATGVGQDYNFRQLALPGMNVRGLVTRVIKTTLLQTNNIHTHIGGFFMATGFFLALFHPFKRNSIAIFRWGILIMWIFAALGMSIYGISDDPLDPNQLHILFMPMMSAFALALISILWARIPLSQQPGVAGIIPFIVIIVVTASPMIINQQRAFRNDRQRTVPGYSPYTHNQILTQYVKDTEIVFTDQPWAVAWYADRTAIWLPRGSKQIKAIEEMAKKSRASIVGIYMTPSIREGNQDLNAQLYGDLLPLTYNLLGLQLGGAGFAERHPGTQELVSPTNGRYNYRVPIAEAPRGITEAFAYTLYTNIDPVLRREKPEDQE